MAEPIDYALPTRRRFRHWRRWMFGVGVALCAVTATRWYPVASSRCVELYLQRQCATWSAPPGSIVYDDRISNHRSPPTMWSRFLQASHSDVPQPSGDVFVHERRTPKGALRLVGIGVYPSLCGTPRRPDSPVVFISAVAEPGTVLHPPHVHMGGLMGAVLDPGFQVTAGECDPNDSSHFSFTVAEKSQTTTWDGWLLDNETVKLEHRR